MRYTLTWLMILVCFAAHTQTVCDSNRLPVILVHGFLASGDTWAGQAQRFHEHGYCRKRIYAFDWNSTGGRHTDSLLDQFIRGVLHTTGARQVNLVGHSAGGGLCYRYLQQPGRASLVAHYAHIGSSRIRQPAGDRQQVPTLVIRSLGDRIIRDTARLEIKNWLQQENDHLQVATSATTFRQLCQFFHDDSLLPAPLIPPPGKTVQLAGRAVTMGDNQPLRDAQITLYHLDPLTGSRSASLQPRLVNADEEGNWGPLSVPAGACLEMEVIPQQGRTVSYFFEPFFQDNPLVYLRTLPASGMGALLLKKLPARNNQVTAAVFSQSAAVIAGRDSLTVNGLSLCTPALTPAEATVIASFLFDDGDGISSGNRIADFGAGVFLNAADIALTAPSDKPTELFYNGRTLRLPAVPGSERILVAVFQ